MIVAVPKYNEVQLRPKESSDHWIRLLFLPSPSGYN